jgi:hypothetical protein
VPRGHVSLTPEGGLDERQLAWALAEISKPVVVAEERHEIFVTLGVGDYFGAIRLLMNVIHRDDIPMSPDLIADFTSWLTRYADDTQATLLRDQITQIAEVRRPPQASTADQQPRSLPIADRYSRDPRPRS